MQIRVQILAGALQVCTRVCKGTRCLRMHAVFAALVFYSWLKAH